MPVLMIFGPEDKQGDIVAIYKRCRGEKGAITAPAGKAPVQAAA